MKLRPRSYLHLRGSALLEVALAVTLLAVSGIGLVATQLSMSRHAQSSAARGQAAFIADAFAEMAVEGPQGFDASEQWKARTTVLIAGGIASTSQVGAYTSSSTVSWPAKPYGPASADASGLVPCTGTSASTQRECVSLAFAQ